MIEAWAAYNGIPPKVPASTGILETSGAVVFGLVLYWIRCRKLFVYGALEVFAAVFTIFFSFAPASQPDMTVCNASVWWCFFQRWLITLAGIYIFVRGLDNMQAIRLLCLMQAWRGKKGRSRGGSCKKG
jgi:hypothetical protein